MPTFADALTVVTEFEREVKNRTDGNYDRWEGSITAVRTVLIRLYKLRTDGDEPVDNLLIEKS